MNVERASRVFFIEQTVFYFRVEMNSSLLNEALHSMPSFQSTPSAAMTEALEGGDSGHLYAEPPFPYGQGSLNMIPAGTVLGSGPKALQAIAEALSGATSPKAGSPEGSSMEKTIPVISDPMHWKRPARSERKWQGLVLGEVSEVSNEVKNTMSEAADPEQPAGRSGKRNVALGDPLGRQNGLLSGPIDEFKDEVVELNDEGKMDQMGDLMRYLSGIKRIAGME